MSASSEGRISRERQIDEEFRAFLNSDRSEEGLSEAEILEQRAKRYLEIQSRLARLFAWRGCYEEDELARIALDRARMKWADTRDAVQHSSTHKPNPVGFVCSFVRFVFLEWIANQAPIEVPPVENRSLEDEVRLSCLDSCMAGLLTPTERELILEYYQDEKGTKIDHRKKIAKEHKTSANALRIECHRIRRRLRECMVRCVEMKRNSKVSQI
jgi:DNA-directed RNA polymerase specialized sigma24 family protein